MLYAARDLLNALGAVAVGLYGMWSWLRGPRPPLELDEVRRILVVRLDLLGDVVLSIPALRALAAAYPDARVDVLALPYTARVLAHVPGVHGIHTLDVNRYRRPAGLRHIGQLVGIVATLRAQRYDLAVGLSGLTGGLFAVLSGARWRVGYRDSTCRGAYNVAVPGRRYRPQQHEIEYCLELVEALRRRTREWGATSPRCTAMRSDEREIGRPDQVTPRLHWAGAQLPEITMGDSRGSRPYAVLVPGASNGSAKRWPPVLWSRLGDRLSRELDLDVVLSGSASERPLTAEVARGMNEPCANLAGGTSLEELAGLLSGARVVVAGDTGPLHLAAALAVPVVGIYGPTDPDNSGPRSERAVVVRRGLSCSPCYDLRTPADCKLPDRSMPCMWEITPDRVCDAVAELLSRGKPLPVG
jgi:lipopolysaccharide heptosyltransferase II